MRWRSYAVEAGRKGHQPTPGPSELLSGSLLSKSLLPPVFETSLISLGGGQKSEGSRTRRRIGFPFTRANENRAPDDNIMRRGLAHVVNAQCRYAGTAESLHLDPLIKTSHSI